MTPLIRHSLHLAASVAFLCLVAVSAVAETPAPAPTAEQRSELHSPVFAASTSTLPLLRTQSGLLHMAVAVTSPANPSYQWTKDGVAIKGAIGSQCVVSLFTPGTYVCVVADRKTGASTSSDPVRVAPSSDPKARGLTIIAPAPIAPSTH